MKYLYLHGLGQNADSWNQVTRAAEELDNSVCVDLAKMVKGKKVTGFTNSEEEAVELTNVVPFLVEDMLQANGGIYSKIEDWAPYVVTDGLLVTGQNPASSEKVAEALLALIRQAA